MNMHVIFESVMMLLQKWSKLVHTCRNYSLLKLAHFFGHSVDAVQCDCRRRRRV